jgi:protein tyrosine phosphatase (PTP) superfamily phosphohydrolase (DUF442 family)
LLRAVRRGCLVGLCLALGVETVRVSLGGNLHVVVPGRVYRSYQLSGQELEQVVQRYGIRTVINLRGTCDPFPWYLDECRTTHRLDVNQEDIGLSAGRLPGTHEMRRLREVLDRTEYPILLHCRRGADRTGLVSTVVRLLQTDASLSEASWQLSFRYGHLPVGRPTYLDEYLQLYGEWLKEQGQAHAPVLLRRWIEQDYCPGVCRCSLTLRDVPAYLPQGQPMSLRVRAENTSTRTWQFRPGTNAGIHIGFGLWNAGGNCVGIGRSGLFEATVAPGQCIDLTLALPAVAQPGRYRLRIDMLDEQQCWFYQTGSEPLELELEVR